MSMSSTMALFVPEWPSADGGGLADGSGTSGEMKAESVNGAAMNGSHDAKVDFKENDGASALAPADPPDGDAIPDRESSEGSIELTQDPLTGSISLSAAEPEADADQADDDEAGEQCKLWSATLNEDDENADGNEGGEDGSGIEVNADPSAFGDIWSTEAFGFNTESPLKDLLDSDNFSLVELLAQDELLQELRGCESRLVDYFGRGEAVAGLVECLMVEVPYSNLGLREGKEKWCQEEEARRQRLKEMKERMANEKMSTPESTPAASSPEILQKKTSLFDASSPKQEEEGLHIEAQWNSPTKKLPGDWMLGSPENQKEEDLKSPSEEYDLRFVRYPYMACEVLCSEVGGTLDVLVDGYVDDVINDEEDSLLGDVQGGEAETKEVKLPEGDEIDMPIIDESGGGSSTPMSLLQPPAPPPSSPLSPPSFSPNTPAARMSKPPQRRILDLLFAPLIDSPAASLDDRRTGYLERVLNVLFRKRSQAMCDYMNASLIVTSDSTGMAQKILNADTEMRLGDNSYVSLSRQTSNEEDIVDGKSARSVPMPKFPSSNAPPVLMCALFDHLHSHSIMHIVQRLLLPSPARQAQKQAQIQQDQAAAQALAAAAASSGMQVVGESSKEEDEDENPNKAMNNEFMNQLNQMNGGDGGQPQGLGSLDDDDDDDDEMEEDDPMGCIFQCDWSEKGTHHALDLLLRRLEGDTSSFLVSCGFPVGYDVSSTEKAGVKHAEDGDSEMAMEGNSQEESLLEAQEASLSCSQHASEILISIIQNSPLDSPAMVALTRDPALGRIVDLIMPSSLSEFAAHDSIMTCAITVLESLILQLGGYGAVATTGEDGAAAEGENSTEQQRPQESVQSSLSEIGPHTPPPTAPMSLPDLPSEPQVANATALLRHVPSLLSLLSNLLTHPATQKWTCLTQYSQDTPRPLLGTSRLRILRLVESLVLLGDSDVDRALAESDVLEKCLELFWAFEWCSMLHQSAANLMVHVFEGGEARAVLQEYFLGRCNLLERLMDAFEDGTSAAGKLEGDDDVIGSTNNDQPAGEGEAQGTAPRCGEMMLAMKNMYQSGKGTSSMESEHGSECDLGQNTGDVIVEGDPNVHDVEEEDVVPVSEDDVDSAMEKECQERGEDIGVASGLEHGDNGSEAVSGGNLVPNNSSNSLPQQGIRPAPKTCFRKGYMGHVIIICQALVHACNNTTPELDTAHSGDADDVGLTEQLDSPLSSPASMDEISTTSSFETSAVQASNQSNEESSVSSNVSKKRKDRSPVRDGAEDIKRLASTPPAALSIDSGEDLFASPTSPIPKVPSSPRSPIQVDTNVVTRSSSDDELQVNVEKSVTIDGIMRQHPLHERWQNFVSSVLASEMSVQSTPLGGQQGGDVNAAGSGLEATSDLSQIMPGIINDTSDNDFLGVDEGGPTACIGSGAMGGLIVGEIDMDENDLDIAASMMEALSLPPSSNGGGDSQPVGHSRRRRVIGGGSLLGTEDPITSDSGSSGSSESGSGIANFGSVIQRPGGFKDYVYDDPLGGVHPFDSADIDGSGGDKGQEGSNSADNEDDGFMSDAMVVSRDGDVSKQGASSCTGGTNGNVKKSESDSSSDAGEDDEDDDDDDVPVMDLFAGSFDPNFANFDAFEGAMVNSDNPFGTEESKGSNGSGDFFAAFDGGTDTAKSDDPFAKVDDPFEVSKTPFDLADTLSKDAEEENGKLHADNSP